MYRNQEEHSYSTQESKRKLLLRQKTAKEMNTNTETKNKITTIVLETSRGITIDIETK